MSRAFPAPDSLAVGALLTLLTALGQICTSLYTPSLPSMAAALGTTAERVNLTFGVFLIGFAVSQLVYGPLSDRFGRRPVLLAGLVIFLAASYACTTAQSIEALIAYRFVQAVGACAGQTLARAVVRDVHGAKGAARIYAYIGAALAVSPAVMPVIGGYLQKWFDWRAAFLAMTAVAALALVGSLLALAETNADRDPLATRPRRLLANYAALLRSPRYLGYTGSVTFVFAGLMCFAAIAPFVFIKLLGLPPERFGMLNVISVTGFMAGTLLAGRYAARAGIDRMVRLGGLSTVVGAAVMTAFAAAGVMGIWVIMLPFALYTFGMGFVFPNAMAGAMAPYPRIAGTASAVLGCIQMGVSALAATLLGRLTLHSQLPLAVALLVLALMAAGCGWLAGRDQSAGS
ncbi:MAG: multidrug effflux MFS transporter [Hyphomicrobiales bacterium]|nr:multidrug effflux MFS transporter [Hyphomicrobiales bacterium]MCP5370200.1 multidrug effflux MFS transporter [Hyphomicrobiales bacterium]